MIPGPVFRRPRREARPIEPQGCRKVPHPDERSAVAHMLSLIVDERHQPERGPLHYYRCPDCGALHVGHDTRRRA